MLNLECLFVIVSIKQDLLNMIQFKLRQKSRIFTLHKRIGFI